MKTVVTVSIVLDIEGSEADALEVIDGLLDNGHVQDAINEHTFDCAGELHVKSAVVRVGAPPVPMEVGGPRHVALWDAINAYAEACGGNVGHANIGSPRMDAVCAVESALKALAGASS